MLMELRLGPLFAFAIAALLWKEVGGLRQTENDSASELRVSRKTDLYLEVEPKSCSVVVLHLESELPEYQLDVASAALSGECEADSIRASIHPCALNTTSRQCPDISTCSQSSFQERFTAFDGVLTAQFPGLLVVNSTCHSSAFSRIALTKLQIPVAHGVARRFLSTGSGTADSSNSSAPTSNSALSPMAAQAPYRQVPNLGPGVNVACCCHNSLFPNAPNGQFCCCSGAGNSDACCSQASPFCEQENCTAILVGSLLIGSVVISSCFVAFWFYRVRTLRHRVNSLQVEAAMSSGGLGRRRRRHREPQVPVRPVKCRDPDPEDEGLIRECPICIEEVISNAEWVIFPCDHGTCVSCYAKLLQRPAAACNCPLCRCKLVEPIPGASPVAFISPIIVTFAEVPRQAAVSRLPSADTQAEVGLQSPTAEVVSQAAISRLPSADTQAEAGLQSPTADVVSQAAVSSLPSADTQAEIGLQRSTSARQDAAAAPSSPTDQTPAASQEEEDQGLLRGPQSEGAPSGIDHDGVSDAARSPSALHPPLQPARGSNSDLSDMSEASGRIGHIDDHVQSSSRGERW